MHSYSSKIAEFKAKLQADGVFGCFSKTTDSSVIEAIGLSGSDYIIVDMEHGPVTTETLKGHMMALNASEMAGIVRVPSWESPLLEKALDLGAHGVQVSSVTSAEQAKKVIRRMKFYPDGERGVCRFVRAADYAEKDKASYFKEANHSLVILQLEGAEAIRNLASILEVKGIDVLFIGPYDLSQSLGVPGQIQHEKVMQAMRKIVAEASAKGVFTGIFCDQPDQASYWKSLGVKYISYSVDIHLLADTVRNLKDQLFPR
ncbi:4-hydroxy-2-oxoheptanedioate aldolase [Cyclonatronum proteinivorum]|uniref:4-hydroxy-2-oxoheptanedioate aldolase n=1 Tax=Cyclonatronum proteinivorum TaxID=1457365 RepID=A0A345UMJ5_9BACT|nr:aldolase/citrate lyase family protein [Cyclonatronum proteinivorum]AXJ01697.1 4-hydroxy-2-oxoheptanedioate aldolase [Cyclonatronum proteinivorum]